MLFAITVLSLPLSCAKLVCFCYKFIFVMLGDSFERKSSYADRKVINTENLELTQDFGNLQSEKLVLGLLSVQSVSPLRSTSAS